MAFGTAFAAFYSNMPLLNLPYTPDDVFMNPCGSPKTFCLIIMVPACLWLLSIQKGNKFENSGLNT